MTRPDDSRVGVGKSHDLDFKNTFLFKSDFFI